MKKAFQKVRLAEKYIAYQAICPCGNLGPLAETFQSAVALAREAGWLPLGEDLAIGPCCRSAHSSVLPGCGVSVEILEDIDGRASNSD